MSDKLTRKSDIHVPSAEGSLGMPRERKRGSERELGELVGQADIALIETEANQVKKKLKRARSQAELTRVRQGYLLITLNCLNVCITGLIALKTFGII